MLRSLIAITVISFGAGPVAAQEAMFILRAGKDTISLERFTVTATRIESEILLKPNAVRLRFSGAIGADGLIGSLENNFWMGTDSATAPSRQRAVITLTGDSAFAAIGGGGPTRTERLGTKAGALPYINPSFCPTGGLPAQGKDVRHEPRRGLPGRGEPGRHRQGPPQSQSSVRL